jgi:AraC family transcriptional regulator, regulatory protein of adaptative response / methylated-DNA-[protein]-cysteine methyltransferase
MNLTKDASPCNSEDYQRIAMAISFMRQNYLSQPDLATIATQVHLSEYHFQRLFTKWAGISPKRFLQYLTIEYAKSKIAETKNLLNLYVDVGLSSAGRLHDLFVNLKAISPGEYKNSGTGLQIRYGIHDTPFGKCLIATTSRGICNLHFLDGISEHNPEQNPEEILRLEWMQAEIIPDQQATQEISKSIFNQNILSSEKPLALLVKGTNFQIQVWRALLQVPFGTMTTYQNLAESIGRPTAARAVGNAVGKNPIAYLIPCHRVIRESGELGGYHWGIERKTAILGWEASRKNHTKNHTENYTERVECESPI